MPSFEIWGHRGARGLFAENTLEGIAAACALGIDGVEIDIAMTADGIPVLSHDPALSGDLARTPGGNWIDGPGPLIRDLPAAALLAFDVGRARPGGAIATAFPIQVPFDGARVARLDDVLALGTRLLIELKTFPGRPDQTHPPALMARAVAEMVLRAGAESRVIIESFDWRGLRWLRRVHPTLTLGFLTRAETEADAKLWWDGTTPTDYGGSAARAIAAAGGAIWAAEYATITRARIEEAHALGLRVIGWTVNRPDEIARLLGWQADGVVTDRPDTARQVLGSAGQATRVPACRAHRPR